MTPVERRAVDPISAHIAPTFIIITVIVIVIVIIIIIIIVTRPRPAFGRLGLGGSSGGYSSHG